MSKYNVHIFATIGVRLRKPGIEANSHEAGP